MFFLELFVHILMIYGISFLSVLLIGLLHDMIVNRDTVFIPAFILFIDLLLIAMLIK